MMRLLSLCTLCIVLAACGGGGVVAAEVSLRGPQMPQVAAIDRTALFDWAARTFPQFFPGESVAGTVDIAPYGTFVYRYFPASGNYLATAGEDIYIYGPLSGYALRRVGALSDYACVVQACTPSYITWGGSANGTVIRDATEDGFQVRVADGQLVDEGGSAIPGFTVDGAYNLLRNGAAIGAVRLAIGASAGRNAVYFFCSDGNPLDFFRGANGGWQTQCMRGFVTWNGNADGQIVVDGLGQRFRFVNDARRCMVDEESHVEYIDFCAGNGASVSVTLTTGEAGQSTTLRYEIRLVRSAAGTCVAGLVNSTGQWIEFVREQNRIVAILLSTRAPPAGCAA